MTAIQKLKFQSQALQNYRRRIKRLGPFLDPTRMAHAMQTADCLEAKIRARWGVRFGGFLRRMNGGE